MEFRILSFVAALLLSVVAVASRSSAENYTVDRSHSAVLFSVGHLKSMADPKFPVSYTYGMFRQFEGDFVFDRDDPAGCQFQLAIDVESIDTNDAKRDEHVKSPDFFNARQFPQITFQSTACDVKQQSGEKPVYQVTGNLTLMGEARQVTLPLELIGEADGPYGNHRVGFHSQFTLKRSDFDMTGMRDMVGDAVGITVSLEGIRQEEDGVRPAGATSQ